MAKSLIERIRAGRQSQVKSGNFTFTIRRPDDLEWIDFRTARGNQQREILKFVVGWGEPTEIDLGIPGGTGDKVPFDPLIFAEWIADHPEHWEPLSNAILDEYKKHDKKMAEIRKNLKPGSQSQKTAQEGQE